MRSRRIIVLVMSLVVVSLSMFVSTFNGLAGQAKEREIKKLNWPKEPVKIGKLKAKGSVVTIGEKFLADDDWLKGLTFSVKNSSDKTITYLEIELNFPREKGAPEEPDAHDRIIYGQYPALPGETATPQPDQPPLRPGDTVDIILKDYEGIREFLNNTHYPMSIRRVEINVGDVIFDDGIKWSGGGLFRRDPNNPGGWMRIKELARSTKDRNDFRYGLLGSGSKIYVFARGNLEEIVPQFVKAGLRPSAATQLSQCYGGCGSNYYSQDEYCGTNTNCAVRYDWVSCTWADRKETSVKIQYDRCVNRVTRVACSTYRFTDIRKPCPLLVSTPQECSDIGYSWSYTSNSCEEPPAEPCGFDFAGGGVEPKATGGDDDAPSITLLPGNCPSDLVWDGCQCVPMSPVVVDLAGDGFRLTSGGNGVSFDMNGDIASLNILFLHIQPTTYRL